MTYTAAASDWVINGGCSTERPNTTKVVRMPKGHLSGTAGGKVSKVNTASCPACLLLQHSMY